MSRIIDPNNVKPVGKVNDIQGTLRIDGYLTTFSQMFRQSRTNFISNYAATNISVENESDKYATYPRGYFWRDEAEVRPLGGRPVQVGYKVEPGQYMAEEWALEHTIDDRQRRNTRDPIKLDENGIALLETKQLIRQDRQWVSKFFKPGVWAHDITGGGAGGQFLPFNDPASTPIATIDEQKDLMNSSTGMMPNTLVLGANVKRALRSNPDITDRIKYTERGVADNDTLASLFEVDRVVVARAVYNAADEGLEDDFQYITDPNSMWLGYIDPDGGLDSVTAIARFAWTGLIPGAGNDIGGVVNRGRDDRAYSDWIHNRNAYDMQVVSPDLGIFFQGASEVISN